MKKRLIVSFVIFLLLLILISICFVLASNVGLIEDSDWGQNLTGIRYGSTSLGDVDNDNDLDLILTGCLIDTGKKCEAGTIAKIYINNGTTLTENSTWQNNLTGVGWSSTSLGDIDNDGDLDLALIGCTSVTDLGDSCNGDFIKKIYINNGSSLIENSTWQSNLIGTYNGHIALSDIDNDGDLDLLQIGRTASSKISKIYINNGTSLVESSQWQSNLTGLDDASFALADINNDGDLDLALTGEDIDSAKKTKIYINNGTSLVENSTWQDNLTGVSESSSIFGDVDNDGDLDYILMGCCDELIFYENNGSTLTFRQGLSGTDPDLTGIFAGSLAFGDYDNDGYIDFAVIGREVRRSRVYWNNIDKKNNFSYDPISSSRIEGGNFTEGNLVWGDLDNDNNLDMIVTGVENLLSAVVLISNVSSTKNNSQSTPPNTFSSSYSDGVLNLTWNNGSDPETNSTGLYYNLMVGNSTTNHTIVSGVYGGSSGGGRGGGPSAGYFGNMMQRKNISLNKYLSDDTYYWYVQTIDTGLRKSNWSARQSIVIGADTDVPTFSSVSSSVGITTATITWTTNESANSSVYYGTTTATTSSSSSASLVISHSISLSSLSASTLYYYNVSSCDYWNNCNTSIQYSFTTSDAPSDDNGNGGSSGSSSSSSSSSTTTITPVPEEKLFDVDFSTENTGSVEAKQGDIKTFSFQGEVKHSVTVMTLIDDSITLLITSDPITIQIKIGEVKQIDINDDGLNDFEIKLISIISGKAKFSLTKLSGADIVALEEIDEAIRKEALFDVKIDISNLFKVVKSGREVIASIEVLNVNNIGQVDVLVDYYISDGKNNTISEGSDSLAVEAVASFVRSLSVPYNAKAGRYLFNVDVSYKGVIMASGNAEFRVVKTYEIIICIVIFILIVAGIFFYLWRIKKKTEKIEKKEARLEKLVRKFKNNGVKKK